MQFKTLIVDDEPLARMRMKTLLEPYSDLVSIIGEASTGSEAVSQIRTNHPDLVFLDIQMPDKNGFDVLKEIDSEEDPLVVFTTAYDEYALKAFAEDTVDYLLKPIEDERLAVCMDKVRRLGKFLSEESSSKVSLEKLQTRNTESHEPYLRRIQAKIGERTILIGERLSLPERRKIHDGLRVKRQVHHQHAADRSGKAPRPGAIRPRPSGAPRRNRRHRGIPAPDQRTLLHQAARQGPYGHPRKPEFRQQAAFAVTQSA